MEATDPEACRAFLSLGHKYCQTREKGADFTPAKIAQPDQPERQSSVDVATGLSGANRRPAGVPLLQEGARIRR